MKHKITRNKERFFPSLSTGKKEGGFVSWITFLAMDMQENLQKIGILEMFAVGTCWEVSSRSVKVFDITQLENVSHHNVSRVETKHNFCHDIKIRWYKRIVLLYYENITREETYHKGLEDRFRIMCMSRLFSVFPYHLHKENLFTIVEMIMRNEDLIAENLWSDFNRNIVCTWRDDNFPSGGKGFNL